MSLEFFITEPRNPVIIYLIENNEPIAQGLKFAAIEGKVFFNLAQKQTKILNELGNINSNSPF